jgi:hypothetical protein
MLYPLSGAVAIDGTNFLRPCTVASTFECIESITATLTDGTTSNGTLTGRSTSIPLSTNDAYLSKIIGTHDEWTFPGLVTQNGGAKVEFYIFHWPSDAKHCDNAGNCSTRQEELAIYARPSMLDGGRPPVIVAGKDAELICAKGMSSCSIGSPPWNFNSEISFHVTLRMTKGFLPLYSNGRTKNFSIETVQKSDSSEITVNFSPLTLENVYFALADFFAIDHGLYVTDEPAMWIYTSENVRTDLLKPCVISGGLSIVTNAFNQWSPTWNAINRSIDVQLRASHLRTDGSINSGYLEIRIPTAMAQCLWGVNLKGEVDARIALTYTDGTPDEVITVSSKEKNGYFSVVSAGFHYSSPKLEIRLNQDEGTPTPSASPTATNSTSSSESVIKKSVKCQKGKVRKVITAVNPKCPSGFKKVG